MRNSANSPTTAIRGVLWTYASYYSGKVLVFISTIILARLLTKEDFGIAGYALVVINSLDVLSDLGVGAAIIYHRKDPKAIDTAFWLGISVSVLLFALTWLGGPLAGLFFKDPRAVPVTQVLAFTFPLAALGNIHDILLRKELSFNRKFIPDVSKALGKGLIAIILAYAGLGAWSLIYSHLVGTLVSTIVLWIVTPWRPSLNFVRELAGKLLKYGLNIVSVNSLSVLINNADYLLVGRYLGAAALGVYTLAYRIPEMLVLQFCALVSKVIFPFYARMNEDAQALSQSFIYATKYITLITLPVGIGVVLVATPLVQVIFGEKWIEAAAVMQAISVYTIMSSLAYNAGDVYKAQGRPELLTYLTILEGVLVLPSLYFVLTLSGSIVLVAWVHAGITFLIEVINIALAQRMLRISFKDIFDAIIPSLISTGIMALAVWLASLQLEQATYLIQLVVGISVGIITYAGCVWLMQRDLLVDGFRALRSAIIR